MEDRGSSATTIFPEKLSFTLARNAQPGALLTIKNTTPDQTCAFKVKTTEPKRYLVRPIQGLIGAGGQESVNVYVVEKECNALLDVMTSGAEPSKDKFMVQTVPVTNEFFDHVSTLPAKGQADELARLWSEVPKKELRNKKLSVEFTLPESAGRPASSAASPSHAPGSAAGGGTPALSSAASERSRGWGADAARGGNGGGAGDGTGGGGGGGEAMQELQKLRRKYEDLVAYTANLTEGRNVLNRELEDKKKALQREMAQRIALESKDLQRRSGMSGGAGRGAKSTPTPARTGGFSFLFLLVSVILCFIAGRWYGAGQKLAPGVDGGDGGNAIPNGAVPAPEAAPEAPERGSAIDDSTIAVGGGGDGAGAGGSAEL
ncbi:unnamed protein product [Phaeothamnion confervicola]